MSSSVKVTKVDKTKKERKEKKNLSYEELRALIENKSEEDIRLEEEKKRRKEEAEIAEEPTIDNYEDFDKWIRGLLKDNKQLQKNNFLLIKLVERQQNLIRSLKQYIDMKNEENRKIIDQTHIREIKEAHDMS